MTDYGENVPLEHNEVCGFKNVFEASSFISRKYKNVKSIELIEDISTVVWRGTCEGENEVKYFTIVKRD